MPVKNRPIHHSLLAIFAAPVAHWHHQRYAGKRRHLAIDTILNIGLWGAMVWMVMVLMTRMVSDVPRISWLPVTLKNGVATRIEATVSGPLVGEYNDVRLTVDLPAGWTSMNTEKIALGTIKSRQSETVGFNIMPVTTPDKSVIVISHLSWTNAGRAYETSSVQKLVVEGTMAELSVTTALRIQNGSTATVKLKVSTPNKNVVPLMYLKLDLPSGVKLVSTKPAQIGGAWAVNGLQNQADQEFTANIQVTGQSGTAVRIGAYLSGTLFQTAIPQLSRMVEIMVTDASATEVVENDSSIQPQLSSEIRYFSSAGMQFGYGPWPPRVGQETVTRVFWYIRSGDEAMTNGVVTMVLPGGVRWVGHQSITGGAQLKYESGTRTVTWSVGSLPAQKSAIVASFDIGFTPAAADRGHYLPLTKTIYFNYRTESSGQRQLTFSALKTSDIDPGSSKSGVVR